MKIEITLLVAIIFVQSSQGLSASLVCGDAIKELVLEQTSLLNAQVLDQKIQNLSELKLALDLAKVNGTSSVDRTAMNANYKDKEQELVIYLKKNEIMTREQLVEKIKLKINELQKQNNTDNLKDDQSKQEESKRNEEQKKEIKDKVIDGTRAIFHRIEPSSFMMGEIINSNADNYVHVTLTKPFDMMATPTTQIIYKTIADLANIRFPEKYKITADPSNFKGDLNPVETVSYEDVRIWISALNKLSKAGEPILIDLIQGHKKGDTYRLPTEAEWEFVIRGRGTLNRTYHFGNQKALLRDYAWYVENAGKTTHAVALKLPLVIDGKEFYDMHGNVSEWVNDLYSKELTGGSDPKGPKKGISKAVSSSGFLRVTRGGGFGDNAQVLRSAFRGNLEGRWNDLGFRLARTVR